MRNLLIVAGLIGLVSIALLAGKQLNSPKVIYVTTPAAPQPKAMQKPKAAEKPAKEPALIVDFNPEPSFKTLLEKAQQIDNAAE